MIHLFVLDKVLLERHHIFPLLKPFFKGKGFTDRERKELYGISEKEVNIVNAITDADYAILPMSWNFYKNRNKISYAKKLIRWALENNLTTLSFTNGDFGVKVPRMDGVYVFRSGGNKSKLPRYHIGLPSFIEDPLQKHFQTSTPFINENQQKPIVGFCGQANGSIINAAKEIIKTWMRSVLYYIRLRNGLPQQLLSTSFLRGMIVKRFQQSNKVISNFILRKKYRAGVIGNEDRERTTKEFYDNLKDSQYIICIRGAGNFSVRFYEAMAMGRIPIFINTDCILPLDNSIDWKKHIVWIDYSERSKVIQKTKQFHENLSRLDFENLQKNNRKLWEEKLTLGGFFKAFFEEMKQNNPNAI